MATRRIEERRVNQEIPPRGVHVPIVCQGNDVLVVTPEINNGQISEVLLAVDRVIKTHVNKGVEPKENAMDSTTTS